MVRLSARILLSAMEPSSGLLLLSLKADDANYHFPMTLREWFVSGVVNKKGARTLVITGNHGFRKT
jgi:hypothetical protein